MRPYSRTNFRKKHAVIGKTKKMQRTLLENGNWWWHQLVLRKPSRCKQAYRLFCQKGKRQVTKKKRKKKWKKLILLGLFFQFYCEDHVHSSKYDSLHIFQFIIIQAAKVSLKGTAVAMEINFHSNTCTIPGEAYMPMKRCEKKNKIKTKVFKVKNK